MKFHTRRPTALAALLLTATFALAGCGSDDGDGVVLLGEPFTFTKDNIGDFDF